jgi:hypothetical protein
MFYMARSDGLVCSTSSLRFAPKDLGDEFDQ